MDFDNYLEKNNLWGTEGPRGVRNLERIMHEVCGYGPHNTLQMFLEDNPGAVQALQEWIAMQCESKQGPEEWKQALDDMDGDVSEEQE